MYRVASCLWGEGRRVVLFPTACHFPMDDSKSVARSNGAGRKCAEHLVPFESTSSAEGPRGSCANNTVGPFDPFAMLPRGPIVAPVQHRRAKPTHIRGHVWHVFLCPGMNTQQSHVRCTALFPYADVEIGSRGSPTLLMSFRTCPFFTFASSLCMMMDIMELAIR